MLISFLGLDNRRKKVQDTIVVLVGARLLVGSLYYTCKICACLKIFIIKVKRKIKGPR